MEARVDSLLVVGINTTVGANLAARWAEGPAQVKGITWATMKDRSGPALLETARQYIETAAPSRVVFCDAAAEPSWSNPTIDTHTESRLRVWARAVREAGCDFTYISSDAVFTGPWLFHSEEGTSHCHSAEARRLRTMEDLVIRVLPEALVVRTHAIGWSESGTGWLEQNLEDLRLGAAQGDPIRHATPILTVDLADILIRAHEERVAGCLHVAGAERLSHEEFLRRLAEQFELPQPHGQSRGNLNRSATGFAQGETSLRASRAKNLLNMAMPMFGDSLERLARQKGDTTPESTHSDQPRLMRHAA